MTDATFRSTVRAHSVRPRAAQLTVMIGLFTLPMAAARATLGVRDTLGAAPPPGAGATLGVRATLGAGA